MKDDKYAKEAEALRKAIIKTVKDAPRIKGLPVSDIAQKLGVPKPTVYAYMERLAAAGVLGYTTVGGTKIYFEKTKRP